MILYLDTSALLKKYFSEVGSAEVIARWNEAAGIATSSVAYAETMASIYRKNREDDMSSKIFAGIVEAFHRDWESFIRVEVSDDLNETIDKTLGATPLRGSDAIHLASALTLQEVLRGDLIFACYDKKVHLAAQKTGLETLPDKLE